LVLTDGNAETVEIASENVKEFVKICNRHKVKTETLLWGNSDNTKELLSKCGPKTNAEAGTSSCTTRTTSASLEEISSDIGCRGHFDIVIGCELMYYRTDPRELLSTVLDLTNRNGLFIHSHVLRRLGQGQTMIDFLAAAGWDTLEIPVVDFISKEELGHHPEWYSVRCLISGPKELIAKMIEESNSIRSSSTRSRQSKWKIFVEDVPDIVDESDEDYSEEALALGSLFKN
jgi:SAM-dependent methyltransferase